MGVFHYGSDQLTIELAFDLLNARIKGKISKNDQSAIEESAKRAENIANGQDVVYGINTGFGPLCNTRISPEQTSKLQKNILLSHSVGVGKPISKELSKLMLILKVHALSKGFSGVSPKVVERIIWHIDNDVIPLVPEQGSVGASGDLAPLSHLFLPLIGEGEVEVGGEVKSSAQVLNQKSLKPVELTAKDGLALINGTQFMLAHGIKLVDEMKNCLWHADLISAMMIEGLQGSRMPFHKKLHEQRPHEGSQHVASKIFSYLKDSEIVNAHMKCSRVQDPYSLRCIPQVHGASWNAWKHLKEIVEIEMNSVTDNPLVFSEDLTISGGNFHGQPIALPMDYACLALSELGNISDRRIYLALEGKYEGTPKLLMKETGLNSGFMILQYTSAALASENKGMCFPSSADSIPTSLGQEDHVSMGSISGRKALKVASNVTKILAIEIICAAQAFDFRKPLKSGETINKAHSFVRQHIDHTEEDKLFVEDINTAENIIQNKELFNAIEHGNNDRRKQKTEHSGIY